MSESDCTWSASSSSAILKSTSYRISHVYKTESRINKKELYIDVQQIRLMEKGRARRLLNYANPINERTFQLTN